MPEGTGEQRGLIVLGSTGTIGRLTLDVARLHRPRLRIVGLSAGRNVSRLAEQILEHRPAAVAVADLDAAAALQAQVRGDWRGEILAGPDAAARLAVWPNAVIVVNGIVGAAGLPSTLAALEAGRRLGLANKESLVVAGHLVQAAQARGGGTILPIDSEHSAIFQCLQGRSRDDVARVTLTASGGPFRDLAPEALARVSASDALRHPTWRMGARITIDAATLFNKGLELIEARWLFALPAERVRAVIHPQSIVHGLVELVDGSVIAQLSRPDMRLPIQLALSYPERWGPVSAPCDLTALGPLTFAEPDRARFPALRLAEEAGRLGGTAPAAINAADEILVEAFLAGRIPFPAIARGLETVLGRHAPQPDPTLKQVLAADAWARRAAGDFLDGARTLPR